VCTEKTDGLRSKEDVASGMIKLNQEGINPIKENWSFYKMNIILNHKYRNLIKQLFVPLFFTS